MRESTAKAMSSDLRRIEMTHEQDLLNLERKYKSEESKLREGSITKISFLIGSIFVVLFDNRYYLYSHSNSIPALFDISFPLP